LLSEFQGKRDKIARERRDYSVDQSSSHYLQIKLVVIIIYKNVYLGIKAKTGELKLPEYQHKLILITQAVHSTVKLSIYFVQNYKQPKLVKIMKCNRTSEELTMLHCAIASSNLFCLIRHAAVLRWQGFFTAKAISLYFPNN
jgi:hypothetical protein